MLSEPITGPRSTSSAFGSASKRRWDRNCASVLLEWTGSTATAAAGRRLDDDGPVPILGRARRPAEAGPSPERPPLC